jgi:hypothetical protein
VFGGKITKFKTQNPKYKKQEISRKHENYPQPGNPFGSCYLSFGILPVNFKIQNTNNKRDIGKDEAFPSTRASLWFLLFII